MPGGIGHGSSLAEPPRSNQLHASAASCYSREAAMKTPRSVGACPVSVAAVLLALAAAVGAQAGWLPVERLTYDDVPSCLSANNARCLVAGESTGVHLIWYDSRCGGYDVFYRYFDGFSWGPEVQLTSSAAAYEAPSLAVDPTGGLHLVWSDLADGTPEIYYKPYDGVSWGSATKLSDGGQSAETPSVAVDAGGRVHVIWREYRADNWGLYYRYFDGVAWSATETLTPPEAYPRHPSVVADGDDLHLVWQEGRTAANDEIYYRKLTGGAWGPEERLTAAEGLSETPTLAVDSAGRVHVFWDDERAGKFEIYTKLHGGAGWGPDEVLASELFDLYGASCAADEGGGLAVVWHSRGAEKGIYLRLFDGAEWLPTERIATVEGAVHNPGVALSSAGRIHAVWSCRVAWQYGYSGHPEVYWRFYDPCISPPELTSLAPVRGRASETTQVTLTGSGFSYRINLWLKRAGADSIPVSPVTVHSSTIATCPFDVGPGAPGVWDVVVENLDLQRDTLEAAFTVEPGAWSSDLLVSSGAATLSKSGARSLAVDSRGCVHLVWAASDGQVHYRCREAGSWGSIQRVDTAAGTSHKPAIAVDSADQIHVVWADSRDNNSEIYYRSSDGVSWGPEQRLTVAASVSTDPAVAIDSRDNIYVVWQDSRLDSRSPDIYSKRYNGSNWEPEQVINTGTLGSALPSIAIDAQDNAHVVWYEDGGWYDPNVLIYRKFDGTAWGEPETIALVMDLWSPVIVADLSGRLHVAWHDARTSNQEGSYEVYCRTFDGSAWGPEYRLTNAVGISRNAALVATPDGGAHVFWSDARWGDYEIYHSSYDGSGWSLNGRLTQASGNSNMPSAASDGAGTIHLVWQDDRSGTNGIYYKFCGVEAATGVEPGETTAGPISRLEASPNPVSSGTAIRFNTAGPCRVTLSVFDVAGRLVWEYHSKGEEPWSHAIPWDGCDSSGRSVGPGVYFCRVTAGTEAANTKVVVVR